MDSNETFIPLAKMVLVSTLLSVASVRNWPVYQMDVHNTFVHSDLEEEVHMRHPSDSLTTSPHQVSCLKKSFYELRQVPCC